MLRSKKIYTYCLILTLILSGCQSQIQIDNQSQLTEILINETKYQVKIVNTPAELQQGLMYTQYLPENQGMLFEFPDNQIRTFWMKNTLIPLDIIFLDSDNKIINIAENTPPCQEIDPQQLNCPTYSSTNPAKFVLELNANQAEKNNFKPGDKILKTAK